MKKFCILTNKSKDPDFIVTKRIEQLIVEEGAECRLLGDPLAEKAYVIDELTGRAHFSTEAVPDDTECIIILGGDGTIIETARAVGCREIPMVGINLGTLGFLSVVEKTGIEQAIRALIAGEYIVEDRMLLDVTVNHGANVSKSMALNDVTVTRSGLSRIIRTDLYINDEFVGSYSGDGILVATPTGSTGYNLSAGGPIVTPEAELMCITPICPHTLQHRSIVVSAKEKIKIVVGEKKKSQEVESYATIDGQMAIGLETGDSILIEKASAVTKLIRFPEQSYFNVLHSKLNS
ncbi:MAG: NAD(+)/NADH kinase [Lachnospiraceae bacterium]|nr:NAD(+)/NADH kinase [Lachnospiraceae bacterium]